MNIKIVAIIIAVILGAFIFRQMNSNESATQPTPTVQVTKPTASINGHTFSLELAKTDKEHALGLSFRESLPQENGLLFLFEQPGTYSFWMKDMKFPIDIIYINGDIIVHVFENVPPPTNGNERLPTYSPDEPADKVLEINAGLSSKFNIKKGDKININL